MTTIVYRDGMMSADSRAYRGGKGWLGTKVKVYKHKGVLVGSSSSVVGLTELIKKWIMSDSPDELLRLVPPDSHIDILAVYPNGEAMFMDTSLLPAYVVNEYYAIGSGNEYAMGALAMGASSKEAVRVAAMFDPFTGNKINTIKH